MLPDQLARRADATVGLLGTVTVQADCLVPSAACVRAWDVPCLYFLYHFTDEYVAQPGNGYTSARIAAKINLPSATVIHENQVRLSSGSEILFDDL